MNKQNFRRGFKAGFPIGLGYLAVSFAFGIMAVSSGLVWWQAALISMTTVTSAGQLAAVGIMIYPGRYVEMLISQFTINMRYSFMSISLAQKVNDRFKGVWRWLFGFMMTDEIFAVAAQEKEVSRSFFAGLCVLPYLGWSTGTVIGALLGSFLPDILLSALGIAIYGMFVAIVVPDMRKGRAVTAVVVVAIILSCIFKYLPIVNEVPSGLAISICAVLAAAFGAAFFPTED